MKRFIEGENRTRGTLVPEHLDDYIAETNPVRTIAVSSMNLIWGNWNSSFYSTRATLAQRCGFSLISARRTRAAARVMRKRRRRTIAMPTSPMTPIAIAVDRTTALPPSA